MSSQISDKLLQYHNKLLHQFLCPHQPQLNLQYQLHLLKLQNLLQVVFSAVSSAKLVIGLFQSPPQ